MSKEEEDKYELIVHTNHGLSIYRNKETGKKLMTRWEVPIGDEYDDD